MAMERIGGSATAFFTKKEEAIKMKRSKILQGRWTPLSLQSSDEVGRDFYEFFTKMCESTVPIRSRYDGDPLPKLFADFKAIARDFHGLLQSDKTTQTFSLPRSWKRKENILAAERYREMLFAHTEIEFLFQLYLKKKPEP